MVFKLEAYRLRQLMSILGYYSSQTHKEDDKCVIIPNDLCGMWLRECLIINQVKLHNYNKNLSSCKDGDVVIINDYKSFKKHINLSKLPVGKNSICKRKYEEPKEIYVKYIVFSDYVPKFPYNGKFVLFDAYFDYNHKEYWEEYLNLNEEDKNLFLDWMNDCKNIYVKEGLLV